MHFTKMHGLGNDFLVINHLKTQDESLTPALAIKLCDRRFGIGADQILWLKPTTKGDARMEILNSDGSTAEMCGNGVRAVALYLKAHGPHPGQNQYHLDTLAGPISLRIVGDSVIVNMGEPKLGPPEGLTLEVNGRDLTYYDVNMGNPHAVIFVSTLQGFPVADLGPVIEKRPEFPKRTNVEFVEVLGPSEIKLRVWERGAGLTLACGTGACAAAVAALQTGRVKGQVTVGLPGGKLLIDWEGGRAPVHMQGPAVEVFSGEISLSDPYWKAD